MPRWLLENPSENTSRMRDWSKTETGILYKERHKEYQRQWKIDNREKFKSKQKESIQKLKLEILEHYSKGTPICACPGCGVTEVLFLQIDHIEGDGYKQRKKSKEQRFGRQIIYWLKKNNFPEGFQILCTNCNYAKRNNRYCPVHQEELFLKYKQENPNKVNAGLIGENHPNYGRHHSAESREKMHKSHLGQTTRAVTKLIQFPDGSRKEVTNIEKFCKENNLSKPVLWKTGSGEYKQHKGFKIITTQNEKESTIKPLKIQTYILEHSNGFKEKINNLMKYCRDNNLGRSNLHNTLKNNKTYKGFKLHYATPNDTN